MTDKPAESAVERWDEWSEGTGTLEWDDLSLGVRLADAALAELKAENEALTLKYEAADYAARHHEQRADEAEAALAISKRLYAKKCDEHMEAEADKERLFNEVQACRKLLAAAEAQVEELREAIRLTREYVGPDVLPAVAGWSWYDAMLATGGWDERDPSNYDGGTTTDRKQEP